MTKCDVADCNEVIEYLPFKCKYCGGTFCKAHRLPENHTCSFELKNTAAPLSTMNKTEEVQRKANIPHDSERLYSRDTYIPVREDKPRQYRSNRSMDVGQPFIYPSNNLNATYTIMILNLVFFILSYIIGEYILLNIYTLFQYGFVQTIITCMFVPGDIISLIFSELVFYSMGKTIEPKFGPKFLFTLYIFSGLFTEGVMLLIQMIGLTSKSLNFLSQGFLSANNGIFIGLIAFFVFLAGPDTRMTFFFFFIPVSMKAKYIIMFLIGYNLVFGIIYLAIGSPYCVESLGSLAGIFAAKLLHNAVRGRITQRWV